MKIRKIGFENHPILGNLQLDFTDPNGEPINTIILAGENGVGKSLIFDLIYRIGHIQAESQLRNEKRFYEIQFLPEEIEILKKALVSKRYAVDSDPKILRISIDYSLSPHEQIKIHLNGQPQIDVNINLFQGPQIRKVYKTIFSDIGINFTPKAITNITAQNIDSEKQDSERSNIDLATQITQLLIDIQTLDALDYSSWAKTHLQEPHDLDKLNIRMKRFTNAFEYMFPLKRYSRIQNSQQNTQGYKEVIFEENGVEMPVSKLSSGEKQIVFRGGFLLKDQESSRGALILIDEPEISLHPSWQLKILDFYKKLFTRDNGEQTSQLIIATHSPFILHNSHRNNDKVFILKKGKDAKTVLADPMYYGWTSEETVREAFNITNFIDENKTIIFLEGETDETYYKKCSQVFERSADIDFKWIGRINSTGSVENTGHTALNQAANFVKANPGQVRHKIILLYDVDTKKREETHGNLLIRVMRENPLNTIFKRGIENLLTLIHEIQVENFYKKNTQTDDYGAISTIKKLNKTALCKFICEELSADQQKIVLAKLNEEIDRIEGELQ